MRATHPSLQTRIVYQVGSPAMFDGKRFLPETGTPIRKMLRNRTLLADCEPDPLTVAICIEKSLTICFTSLTWSGAVWLWTKSSLVVIVGKLPSVCRYASQA